MKKSAGREPCGAGQEFQCVLNVIGKEDAVLCDGSATFYARMGLTDEARGTDVSDSIERNAGSLLRLIREMDGKAESYSSLMELEDGLWEVAGTSMAPYAYIKAWKSSEEELVRRYECVDTIELSEYYTPPGHRSMMVQRMKDGEYRVLSCNREAMVWRDKRNLLKKDWCETFALMRGGGLLDICARHGAGLCVQDLELYGEGGGRYVKLMCLPMGREAETLLVLCLESTREAFLEQHRCEEDEFSKQFNNCLYGVCMLMETEGRLTPEHANSYCVRMLQKELTFRELIECQPVQRSVKSQVAESGSIRLETGRFSVTVIPTSAENGEMRLLVTVVPAGDEPDESYEFPDTLTPRESQVLTLVVQGYPNRYIARKLGVKEGTVKKLVSNGYRKLGVGSRVELCRRCIGFNVLQ